MTDYIPQNPAEQYFYDALWKYANPAGDGELGGKAAVTFFQMSGVDIGILKQIWSLSTPTASMSREQFNSAIRYITMMQQGEIPLNKERLRSAGKVNLGLPKFNGIDIPPYKAPVAAPAINPALYAITPKDHVKYHELFLTYDTDRDGFLTYDECMNIFRQSGVDPQALTAIYAMSDDDKDTRVTSKEFSVAFHLIICMSKKSLPLPTALPPMLKGFLLNAPAVPGVPPPAAGAPAPGPAAAAAPGGAAPVVPATQFTPVHAAAPAPSSGFDAFSTPAASAPPAAATGFDAFDVMDHPPSSSLPPLAASSDFGRNSPVTAAAPAPAAGFGGFPPAAAPVPQPAASHYPPQAAAPAAGNAVPPSSNYNKGLTYSEKDEYELSQSIDAIKATTKKSLTSQETLLDNNGKAVSSLQGLKQKLYLDKISLEATVNNAHVNTQESIARLEATIAEVSQLTEQLKELRGKLDHAQKTQLDVEGRHNKVNSEKAALVRAIEDVLKQLAAANGDVISKTNEANATQYEVNVVKQSNTALFEQESVLKHTAADLANEIATLKHILTSVSAQRDQALRQVGNAHAKVLSSNSALKQEKEIQSAKQGAVSKLNRQVAAQKSDKQHLLTEIEHHTDDGDHHYHHDSDAEEAHFGYDDTFEEKYEKHNSFHDVAATNNRSSYKSFEETEHHEDDAFASAAGASHAEDPFSAPVMDSHGGFGDSGEDAFGSAASDAFSNKAEPSGTQDAFDTFSPASSSQKDPFSDDSSSFSASAPVAAAAAPVSSPPKSASKTATADPFGSFGEGNSSSAESADPFASSGAFDSFGGATAAATAGGFDDFSSTPATAAGGDGFDSFSATTASTGFDDFSAPASGKAADAFDSFGTSAAAPGFDAFGAAPAGGSDGFDSFGSSAAASAGAFDAFGSAPAAAAASGDAFDAFGSAGAASAGDEDPFASFGAEKASDDPFA